MDASFEAQPPVIQNTPLPPSPDTGADSLPGTVFQLGVYRSASTWAANVLAEILRPHGPVRIAADDVSDPIARAPDADARVVVKANRPSPALAALMKKKGAAPMVITVREPLDCVASLMLQFGERFDPACAKISQSCHAVLQAMQSGGDPLVLRYEDDPRDAATVRRLAQAVGVRDADAAGIAARLTPTKINELIAALIADGTFGDNPSVHDADPDTLWHPHHLGSGEAGRFRDILTPFHISAVIEITREFRARFGYTAHTPAALRDSRAR